MASKLQDIYYSSEIVTRVVASVISISALFLSFDPSLVVAHGTGFALQNTVGSYSIDVHYPYPFTKGVPIWLNFFLSDARSWNPASFGDADISIVQADSDEVMMRLSVNRERGTATGAIVTFPEAGNYRIHLAFNEGDSKVVETDFNIEVVRPEGESVVLGVELNKELGIGVVLGILLALGLIRLGRSSESVDDTYKS